MRLVPGSLSERVVRSARSPIGTLLASPCVVGPLGFDVQGGVAIFSNNSGLGAGLAPALEGDGKALPLHFEMMR